MELGVPKQTIKNVMKKSKMCDNSIVQSIIDSELTKKCNEVYYPGDMDSLSFHDNVGDIFLCLNVYDTLYKICHYIKEQQWAHAPFHDNQFDVMIQHFVPKGSNEETKFCNDLKEYSPMYNETKPALSKLADMLKQSDKCVRICFDLYDNFNPLCAILAWIKSIDKEIKEKAVFVKPVAPIVASLNNSVPTSSNQSGSTSNVQSSVKNNHSLNDTQSSIASAPKEISLNTKNSTEVIVKNVTNNPIHNSTVNNTVNSDVVSKNKYNKLSNLSTVQGNEKQLKEHRVVDVEDTKSKATNVETISVTNHKGEKVNVNNNNMEPQKKDDSKGDTQKDIIHISVDDDIKSTLSEHTQDNVKPNNIDSDDLADDQPPYGNGDGLEQPSDIDNRNMAQPEQREMVPQFRGNNDDEESHFFTYFAALFLACIVGYIGYHNKQKILAIVLEGRRTKSNRGRRRPSTANYRKLDCTLEEAITSQCNANVTHVIY